MESWSKSRSCFGCTGHEEDSSRVLLFSTRKGRGSSIFNHLTQPALPLMPRKREPRSLNRYQGDLELASSLAVPGIYQVAASRAKTDKGGFSDLRPVARGEAVIQKPLTISKHTLLLVCLKSRVSNLFKRKYKFTVNQWDRFRAMPLCFSRISCAGVPARTKTSNK